MELKDIQIQILTQTIGNLHAELSEMRATVIVLNNELKNVLNKQEVQDGEHQDSSADESDIS